MENLVNPRCVKQKYSFSQRVFENWSYFTVSVIIQASSKHQLLKMTVRIPLGLLKILGMTRRAFDWQKNYSRPCSIMCWKMCAWFKFSYGVKNLLLNVYQYFILLAFFRFPQFIGEYGGKAPDFWHADKALCGYKIIWSHYWEIQRSSTNFRSRGYTNTATKKQFYRCSWTKRGKSTDYKVLENTVQNKCILGPSYNIILNTGAKNKADEVCVNPKSHWLLFCYIVEGITWLHGDMLHIFHHQKGDFVSPSGHVMSYLLFIIIIFLWSSNETRW